jgi:hypothetical protein
VTERAEVEDVVPLVQKAGDVSNGHCGSDAECPASSPYCWPTRVGGSVSCSSKKSSVEAQTTDTIMNSAATRRTQSSTRTLRKQFRRGIVYPPFSRKGKPQLAEGRAALPLIVPTLVETAMEDMYATNVSPCG